MVYARKWHEYFFNPYRNTSWIFTLISLFLIESHSCLFQMVHFKYVLLHIPMYLLLLPSGETMPLSHLNDLIRAVISFRQSSSEALTQSSEEYLNYLDHVTKDIKGEDSNSALEERLAGPMAKEPGSNTEANMEEKRTSRDKSAMLSSRRMARLEICRPVCNYCTHHLSIRFSALCLGNCGNDESSAWIHCFSAWQSHIGTAWVTGQ